MTLRSASSPTRVPAALRVLSVLCLLGVVYAVFTLSVTARRMRGSEAHAVEAGRCSASWFVVDLSERVPCAHGTDAGRAWYPDPPYGPAQDTTPARAVRQSR